jgi:hypothetical protein
MATKYHVVPDRYGISVNLLYRPENDIRVGRTAAARRTTKAGRQERYSCSAHLLRCGKSAHSCPALAFRRTARIITPRF